MDFKKSNLMYLHVVSTARIRMHHSLSISCQTQIMEKSVFVAHVGAKHQILAEYHRQDQFQEELPVKQVNGDATHHTFNFIYLPIALANCRTNKIRQH